MNPEDTSAQSPEAGHASPENPVEPPAEPVGGGLPVVWRWAIAAAIVALLAYPIVRRMGSGSESASVAGDQKQLGLSAQYYQAGRYDDAIKTAQEVLKANPNSAEAYNNMAVSYLGLKRYSEAIQSAQQALRVNPNFQLARNNLAWIQQEQAKGGGGNTTPPAAGTPDYFLNQSLALYQAGRYQECIDAARQAVKLRPDYAEAYNNIAAADASMGKWDDAIQNALLALRINPNFQLAKNNLAWAQSGKLGKQPSSVK